MNSKNKKKLGWLAFIFVIFHSLSLFIYAFPQSLISSRAHEIVEPYVYPMFQQKWSMFAPCPLITSSLEMKIHYENDSIDWFSPASEAGIWHSYLRVTHHAELALLEANILHWIYVDVKDLNLMLNEPIPDHVIPLFYEGHSYNLLRRYIYGNSLKIKGKEPSYAEVRCSFYNVKEERGGDIYLPMFKWE